MEIQTVVAHAINTIDRLRRGEEAEPADVVSATRNLFRRRHRQDGETRGRKPQTFKFAVFLLSKSNDDFVPSPSECNRLQRCGLGYPLSTLPPSERHPSKVSFDINKPIEEFEDFICNLYPNQNLRMAGFLYAKANKSRKLERLTVTVVPELKKKLGQGKLFLIPKRDLRTETASDQDESVEITGPQDVPLGLQALPSRGDDNLSDAGITEQEEEVTDRQENNSSYTDADTPTVSFRRRPAVQAREALNHNVDVTLEEEVSERQTDNSSSTDTPRVSIRRRAAVQARETIRHNAEVILSPDEEVSVRLRRPLRLRRLADSSSPRESLPSAAPQTQGRNPEELIPRPPPTTQATPASSSVTREESSPVTIPTDDRQQIIDIDLKQIFDELEIILTDSQNVNVKREKIVEDVLKLYENDSILQHRLQVNFSSEDGQDAGGLTKDMMTQFWEECFKLFFTGHDVSVPFIPIHRYSEAMDIYPRLGRVLCHGLALNKTLPIRLCRSVLHLIIHGQAMRDENILLEDFLSFISDHERFLTEKAISSFDSLSANEVLQLTDMFARFSVTVLPTKHNFRQNIINLAKSELTAKPMFLCSMMKSGIPALYMDLFFHRVTQEQLNHLYDSLRPSARRVIEMIIPDHDPLRPEEDRVLYFLKDLIYSLSSDDLSLFLQFVTGSSLLPSMPITISFSRIDGLWRHPKAHTCGNVLDLPVGYDSIEEFKREFLTILHSSDSMRMSML